MPLWRADPGAPSITVSFRDLDLSSIAGATTLYRRIQAAAKQVSGYAGADLMLTAVHTGHAAEMPAMLSK
jgi:UrcA family protein